MTPSILDDALAYLRSLQATRSSPGDARAALRALAARHPEASFELVWSPPLRDETEISYDLLITLADQTVSLGCASQGATPWPLRGARRWRDKDILRCNDRVTVTVEQAMAGLFAMWNDDEWRTRLVDIAIVRSAVVERDLTVDDDELAAAESALRRLATTAPLAASTLHMYATEVAALWKLKQALAAEQRVFEEWLAGERARAKIEWNWGPSA